MITEVPSDRYGRNGHELNQRIFPLNNRKQFFTVREAEPYRGCLREVVKPPGHGSGQLNLGCPSQAEWFDQMTSRDRFQPKPIYDSVILFSPMDLKSTRKEHYPKVVILAVIFNVSLG